MILKLKGRVVTRYAVEQLAALNPDVTEVDVSAVEVIGASTMHQFMLSFPDAQITGLEGFNAELHEMVSEMINSDEFKRNQNQGGRNE